MKREQRLAGRAIRKQRREQRERIEQLGDVLAAFSGIAAAVAESISAMGSAIADAIGAVYRDVLHAFECAARERARREFEWRLSFRALEAPRHDER